MEIFIPKMKHGDKTAGVYKISFDNSYFYIGSSKDLKQRFRTWKGIITNFETFANKNFKRVIPTATTATFEIIKRDMQLSEARTTELSLLEVHWTNPFLINRSPHTEHRSMGNGGKKIKPCIGYEKKVKKRGIVCPPIRIAQFDLSGNLINTFRSKYAACMAIGLKKTDRLNQHLLGRAGSKLKGYRFFVVAEDGSYVAKPITKPSAKPRKAVAINPDKLKRCQPFLVIDKDGRIIGQFDNCTLAAIKLFGSSRANSGHIKCALNGTAPSHKSCLFVYTSEYSKAEVEYKLERMRCNGGTSIVALEYYQKKKSKLHDNPRTQHNGSMGIYFE